MGGKGLHQRPISPLLEMTTDMGYRRRGESHESATGMGILLIEDQEQDRFLVKKLLQKQAPENQDYALHWRASLLEGLEYLENPEHAVHCILLDLNLPDARGLEVLLRIKKAHPHIPIIIMTGLEDEKTLESAVRFGAHSYIIKKDIARSADIWARIVEAIFSAASPGAGHSVVPHRECRFSLDAEHNVTTWDESCELITSWPADRIIGKPLEMLSVKGFRDDIHEALNEPHAHLDKAIEFDAVSISGDILRLELSAFADTSGDAQQVVWQLSLPADELESTIATQVLNAVVHLSQEMLLVFDTDGRIHRCSDTAARLLGVKKAEIIGNRVHDLTDISSSNLSRNLLRSIRQGQAFNAETYAFTGSGDYPLSLQLSATPLRDNFGGLIGGCLIASLPTKRASSYADGVAEWRKDVADS